MNNDQRTEGNKKDQKLESVLNTLNSVLIDDEESLIKEFTAPKYPPVFIVGNARSGTTLIYQYLSYTGLFSYPSNLISRFYNAPYIGALIHKIYVDFDKHGEILGNEKITFKSNLGKTKSAISPHEFWYFWRRFFQFGEIQKLTKSELDKVDSGKFLQELAALESAFDKPLLMKGMILNWNLEYLLKLMPNAVFIHIIRDPLYNMHSLYKARLKFYGTEEEWYSFKPPEYDYLRNCNTYEQLAGQVISTNRAIKEQLSGYNNYVKIRYEQFCRTPHILIKRLNIENEMATEVSDFKDSNTIDVKSFDMMAAKESLKQKL